MIKKYLVIASVFINLNACACLDFFKSFTQKSHKQIPTGTKEELLAAKSIVKYDKEAQTYYHYMNRPKFKKSDFCNLAGYIYNDTAGKIAFWVTQNTRFTKIHTIEPHEKMKMPELNLNCPIFEPAFRKSEIGSPNHYVNMMTLFDPTIGDYGIIIKKSDQTDLAIDIVPIKELYAREVHEAGINPKPIANIVAEYVGTDIELPEEREEEHKAEKNT